MLLLFLACTGPGPANNPSSGPTTPTDTATDTHTGTDTDSATDSTTEPPPEEVCDGIDNDGDGAIDEDIDADADGYEGCAADCEDTDAAVNPGATEVDDGIDNNCNSLIDEGHWLVGDFVITEVMVDPDAALDRYAEWVEVANTSGREVYLNGLTLTDGTNSGLVTGTPTPLAPGGYIVIGTSTDSDRNGGVPIDLVWSDLQLDNEAGMLDIVAGTVALDSVTWGTPTVGASFNLDAEVVDPIQNDDEALWCVATVPWADGDAGSPGVPNELCATLDRDGDGYSIADGDCDDDDPAIHPSAAEVYYDGVDDNCILTDDNDADGDGSDADFVGGSDCDDTSAAINLAAPEVCDGVDNDCDSDVDALDADATDLLEFTVDMDEDGYGSDDSPVELDCVAPEGYGPAGTDCDDSDSAINPAATEICGNGDDDDCDGGPNGCGFSTDLSAPDGSGVISGESGTYFGTTLGDLGDVTGDGFPDLAVSTPQADGGVGSVTIYSLVGPGVITQSAVVSGDDSNDQFGDTLTAAGDVDGDGYPDFLISAVDAEVVLSSEGVTWLFPGPVAESMGTADGLVYCYGEASTDGSGKQTATADVDGDGTLELLLTAIYNDDGGAAAGATYVVDWAGEAAIALADATLIITGADTADYSGRALAPTDWDGDGVSEVAISSSDADNAGSNAGAVWIVAASGTGVLSLADAEVVWAGDESAAAFGAALAGGFDADGDGIEDLLIGATGATGESTGSGAVFVVSGGSASASSSEAVAVLEGGDRDDHLGTSVAAGDFDGDGEVDAATGAPGADPAGTNSGEVRVFLGPWSGRVSADYVIFGDDIRDGFGISLTTLGDQDGDGDEELVAGTPNADDAGANAGAVYWFMGGSGW